MTTTSAFLFRKTLIEPLGSSLYEFPYRFADEAWPLILDDRSDPYETVSMQIGGAGGGKKAHVARVADLFEQTMRHVGTANVRADTLVTVRVHKTTGVAPNQQPMQLLAQPRTFEFHTHVANVELAKILLSHDPTRLDVVVRVDHRHQRGPVPLRNLRAAYRAALLDFTEAERHRLGAADGVRPTDLRSAPVVVQALAKGTAPPPSPHMVTPVLHQQQQQQQHQQQHVQEQPMQYVARDGQPAAPARARPPSADAEQPVRVLAGAESGSPVRIPGASGGQIYPMTSPTSAMYAPHMAQQQQPQQQLSFGSAPRTPEEAAAREARRKDQPPAPFLQPGLGQTSMYYEMGQYGAATAGTGSTALPPDFFASA